MKKVDNSLHSEDIELPVIYTVSKYKMKRGEPVIDPMTNQPIVVATKDIDVKIPWTQVVTTTGEVPWMEQPNDGVVTKKSMTARTDIDYIEIPNNHYEIVQCNRAVEVIKKSLQKVK